ncbi:MAG: glycine zipper 2TM domain-containing protein, partial [Stenotrophobium sp.]
MNKLNTAALVVALGVSTAASANPYYDAYDNYDGSGEVVYAPVVDARPVYREVSVAEPRQECYQQQVVYDDGYRNDFAGTLLGGLVGGVVGHSFGRGS